MQIHHLNIFIYEIIVPKLGPKKENLTKRCCSLMLVAYLCMIILRFSITLFPKLSFSAISLPLCLRNWSSAFCLHFFIIWTRQIMLKDWTVPITVEKSDFARCIGPFRCSFSSNFFSTMIRPLFLPTTLSSVVLLSAYHFSSQLTFKLRGTTL